MSRPRTVVVIGVALLAIAALLVLDLGEGDSDSVPLLAALFALIGYELTRSYREEGRLSQALAEEHSRSSFLMEQTPAIFYVSEHGGTSGWRYISPYVEELLGFTAEEWMSDPPVWEQQVHPDDRNRAIDGKRRSRRTGRPTVTDYRIFARDGEEVWLRDISVGLAGAEQDLVQGVMYDITSLKQSHQALEEREESLLHTVGQRERELEQLGLDTLQRLAVAAEMHEEGSQDHILRVGRTAARLAAALDLPAEQVHLILRAAPLHDIGKLAVGTQILTKPGSLDQDEWAAIRRHTIVGARLLSGSESPVLQVAEQVALTHHERWDGSGYPNGLAGTDIPICGRITAVADVFDALTHERPYKAAWSAPDAVEDIRAGSGTRFDPDVVDAFLRLDPEVLLAPVSVAGISERLRV